MKKLILVVLFVFLALGIAWSADKKVTINVWHIWPDASSEASYVDFNQALTDYKKLNPNVEVNVDSTTNDLYKPKIQTALSADEAPDVFFTFGSAFSKPFVDAGKIAALDPYMDTAYKSKLLAGTTAFFTYDGKLYGLPLGMHTAWLYCNRDLFQKYGLKYPKTFDDLVNVTKAFKSKGVVPFALGNKERWPIILLYETLAVKYAGAKTIQQQVQSNKLSDPAYLKAARDIKRLVDAGAFRPDVLGVSMFAEGFQVFKDGQVPMFYHGSWMTLPMEADDAATKGKIDVLRWPMVTDSSAKGSEFDTWGGSFSCFSVSAKSKVLKDAVEFAKYVTFQQNKYAFINGTNLPCYRVDVTPDQVKSDINKQVIKLMDKSTSFTIGWDLMLEQKNAQEYMDNITKLLGGALTPEQFVATLPK